MKIYLNERLSEADFWTFDDEEDTYKNAWLKLFDGTRNSVDLICSYLDISISDITEIYFPSFVESLGSYVFVKTFIEDVVIPSQINYIDKCAFGSCYRLKRVAINSDNLTDVGDNVFDGCQYLEEVILPDTLEIISRRMFSNCRNLRSINLPKNLRYIGTDAFYDCRSLEKLFIPDNIGCIKPDAFRYCPNLTIYTKNQNVINYCESNEVKYSTDF